MEEAGGPVFTRDVRAMTAPEIRMSSPIALNLVIDRPLVSGDIKKYSLEGLLSFRFTPASTAKPSVEALPQNVWIQSDEGELSLNRSAMGMSPSRGGSPYEEFNTPRSRRDGGNRDGSGGHRGGYNRREQNEMTGDFSRGGERGGERRGYNTQGGHGGQAQGSQGAYRQSKEGRDNRDNRDNRDGGGSGGRGGSYKQGSGGTEENFQFVRKPEVKLEADAWSKAQSIEKMSAEALPMFQRKVRALLNKMTENNYERILINLKQQGISSDAELHEFIRLVYEKSITQPMYVQTYSQLCMDLMRDIQLTRRSSPEVQLSDHEEGQVLPAADKLTDTVQEVTPASVVDTVGATDQEEIPLNAQFRLILINRIQEAFEKLLETDFDPSGYVNEEDKFEGLLKFKERVTGTLRFAGELLLKKGITPKIGLKIIDLAISSGKEHVFEALSQFLHTVKPYYCSQTHYIGRYGTRILEIKKITEDDTISTRVRCLLIGNIEEFMLEVAAK